MHSFTYVSTLNDVGTRHAVQLRLTLRPRQLPWARAQRSPICGLSLAPQSHFTASASRRLGRLGSGRLRGRLCRERRRGLRGGSLRCGKLDLRQKIHTTAPLSDGGEHHELYSSDTELPFISGRTFRSCERSCPTRTRKTWRLAPSSAKSKGPCNDVGNEKLATSRLEFRPAQ